MKLLHTPPVSGAWPASSLHAPQVRLRPQVVWVVWVVWVAGLLMVLAGATPARAQDDPPGRVGRLAQTQGPVSWYDHEEARWGAAEVNRPVTAGDRVSTGAEGRAELRVGSSTLRLGPRTELEVLRLDDQRLVFQLHSGKLALRIRSREIASEVELNTAEARYLPQRAGHYRLDRDDDRSVASSWRGSLQVLPVRGSGAGFESGFPSVETGQSLELWRDAGGAGNPASALLRSRWDTLVSDSFAQWVQREDQLDRRESDRLANPYVSPEMTGAEDLDRYGRWDQHPEHGPIWLPADVASDWAPYRFGRWAWVRPWGWTWVDNSRWGFAPFHYGRWVQWRGRWGWCPGEYVARPVYAPALVARVGGPHVGVTVNIGLPPAVWVPLAPRERFVPHYRHTPHHVERINTWPGHRHGAVVQPGQPFHSVHTDRPGHPGNAQPVPTGPVMYGQQGVPGAVTPVARDVLRSAPVAAPAAPAAPATEMRPPQPESHPGHRGRDEGVVDLRRQRVPTPVVAVPAAPAAPVVATAPGPTPAAPVLLPPPPRPRPDVSREREADRGREGRDPRAGRDDGNKRQPESRQNMRERQNLQ